MLEFTVYDHARSRQPARFANHFGVTDFVFARYNMNANLSSKTKRGFHAFSGLLLAGILILGIQISRPDVFSQTTSPASPGLTQQETGEAITLLGQIRQQRSEIDENEAKITEKLAEIVENVRQTRIFAARATR